jgi:hypothetical protein
MRFCRGIVDAFSLLGVYLCPRWVVAVHNHRPLPGWDRPVVLVAVGLLVAVVLVV